MDYRCCSALGSVWDLKGKPEGIKEHCLLWVRSGCRNKCWLLGVLSVLTPKREGDAWRSAPIGEALHLLENKLCQGAGGAVLGRLSV